MPLWQEVGKAIKRSGIRREGLFITTKLWVKDAGLKDYSNRDEFVIATKLHGRMHEGPNGAGLSRKAIMSEILGL